VGAILSQEAKVNGERNDEEDSEAESEWCEELVAAHGSSLAIRRCGVEAMVAEGG
jgi:hypothetical protein